MLDADYEISAYISDRNTNGTHRFKLGGGYDLYHNASLSPFLFAQYEDNQTSNRESLRAGIGIAWLMTENTLKFPYRHKLSYALVKDPKHNLLVHSIRHKFKAYINKVGISATIFHLGYTHNLDLKITYKLNNNISLLEKFYFEDYKADQYMVNSIGFQISF